MSISELIDDLLEIRATRGDHLRTEIDHIEVDGHSGRITLHTKPRVPLDMEKPKW